MRNKEASVAASLPLWGILCPQVGAKEAGLWSVFYLSSGGLPGCGQDTGSEKGRGPHRTEGGGPHRTCFLSGCQTPLHARLEEESGIQVGQDSSLVGSECQEPESWKREGLL